MRNRDNRIGAPRRRLARRGFNLVEMLIALAITAALLAATMVALDASFMAYQSTTEVASTHTIGRLTMHRILALVRTGIEFTPVPDDPRNSVCESDYLDIRTPDGAIISIEWREEDAEEHERDHHHQQGPRGVEAAPQRPGQGLLD